MRKIYIFFALAILFMMTGCNKAYKLTVPKNEIILNINEEYVINYEVANAPDDIAVVFEASSDIIIVDDNTITALKIGADIVHAYLEDDPSINIEIVVIVEPSFTIKSMVDSLYISENYQIEINNKTTSELNLNWFSSNDDVATIENGLLTAHKIGKTTISIINNKTNEREAFEVN